VYSVLVDIEGNLKLSDNPDIKIFEEKTEEALANGNIKLMEDLS
jgi:hypothetical protein